MDRIGNIRDTNKLHPQTAFVSVINVATRNFISKYLHSFAL